MAGAKESIPSKESALIETINDLTSAACVRLREVQSRSSDSIPPIRTITFPVRYLTPSVTSKNTLPQKHKTLQRKRSRGAASLLAKPGHPYRPPAAREDSHESPLTKNRGLCPLITE